MKSNYGAADWSFYAWKRSSSYCLSENSSHDLPHEGFIMQVKHRPFMVGNYLASRSL